MKKLSDCRVLLVDDAKANLDFLVEGFKPDHKLSLALNGENLVTQLDRPIALKSYMQIGAGTTKLRLLR